MRNFFTRTKKLHYLLCALFLSFAVVSASAQQSKVSGKITDEAGIPIVGASIIIKGTQTGSTSDSKGNFSINASGNPTLQVIYIGYETAEVPVGNRKQITITLKESSTIIEEVVAIGYGTQKKVSVTGALGTIKGDELLKSPVASVGNSLMGRTPGLVAVQRSGEPGKDNADIFIRGVATFADGSSKPLVIVDGIERSFNQIDPNEIESINILKDASATAVYGVRGANGVIIVTTKVGRAGKPQVNFSANVGFQNPATLPKLLGAYDYARLHNQASINDKLVPAFSDNGPGSDMDHFMKGDDPYFHPDVDHQKMLLREYSPQQQYNVNVGGGSETARYFVSLGVFDQKGMIKHGDMFEDFSTNPKYTRYNVRANIDLDWTKNFSTSIKMGTSITDSNYGGSSADSFMGSILGSNPIASPVLIDGKIIRGVDGSPATQITNPPLYQLLNEGYNRNFTSTLNIDISAKYKLDFLTKGLAIRGKVAYDNFYHQKIKKSKVIPMYMLYRTSQDPNSPDYTKPALVIDKYEGPIRANGEDYSKNRKFYAEAAIEYNRTFTGGHTVTGLILGNAERFFNGANELPYNYIGLVGRVTYNYRNRYMAEVNVGYNGSENFAKGKQYGLFPAMSLGYVVSEEPFFPKNDIVTLVKLRGSIGLVGNDKSKYRFLFQPSSYADVTNNYTDWRYFFGQSNILALGLKEKSLGNDQVTWETARKTNLGVDLKFFKNSLSVSADYFTEERKDILWNLNIPQTFGQTSLVAPYNIGQAENKGFEVEASYSYQINQDMGFWLSGNYSFARNKIVYMDETPKPYPGLVETGSRIGQPKGLLFNGFYNSWDEINDPKRPISEWEGSNLQPGDVKYVDVNKDGIINDNDRVNIGYPNIPEIVYGFSFGYNYKGFDISVLFQGAGNVSTYLKDDGVWAFSGNWKSAPATALKSWSEERYKNGATISMPRLTLGPNDQLNNYRKSSLWLQDASYLRLKNVEIGYKFSLSALKKVGLNSMRVYVNGQNLCTWTDVVYYDPEKASNTNGATYPIMRVFNIGVSLQF